MKRYASKKALAIDIAYGIICLYILLFQTSNVWGNLEASFIWAYPMYVSHTLIHRKINQENKKNDN